MAGDGEGEKKPGQESFSIGGKGVSRVCVYRREPGGPIWLDWQPNGVRSRVPLRVTGKPLYDFEIAKTVAKGLSRGLEDRAVGSVREALGLKPLRTLKELLDTRHANLEPGWAESYVRGQAKKRTFWLRELGGTTAITEIKAAAVEAVVQTQGDNEKWKNRTRQDYLRYLVDSYLYAQHKLKWINEEDNLSAVTIPQPDGESKPYSERELEKILEKAEFMDLRVWAALEIMHATGRRIGAVRRLTTADFEIREVEMEDGTVVQIGIVYLEKSKDKARRSGEAALTPTARRAVEALLATKVVKESGWLFPNRANLHRLAPTKNEAAEIRPMTSDAFARLIQPVEEAAGVPHVKGRATHAVKRRSVTLQTQEAGNLEVAAKQSGTNAATLRRWYLQDDLEPKVETVIKLDERRERRRKRASG